MKFDPNDLTVKQAYKLLTGTVLPRPIGWISTVSTNGIRNLAPFSYFNAVGEDPPHVLFSSGWHKDGRKDTAQNIFDTGEFAANLVHEGVVEKMNLTATILPPEVDEFEFAGVTAVSSEKITPPRVQESLVSFECKLVHHYQLENARHNGNIIFIGRIVMMHIDDSILLDNHKIDIAAFAPVGRLAGSYYSRTNDLFAIDRLPPQR